MIPAQLYTLAQNPTVQSLSVMQLRATTLLVKFALTLFIARFLGLEELGLFGLIMAAAITAPSFLGFGLMQSLSRHAVTVQIADLMGGLKNYLRFISLLYLIVFTVAMVTGVMLDRPLLVFLIILTVYFEHLSIDGYQLLLNLSRPFVANMLHFLRAGLWAIIYMILAFFIPALRNAEALMVCWMIGSLCAALGLAWTTRTWPWRQHAKQSDSFQSWFLPEFRQSKALYLNGLACSIGTYADRYIVTFLLGLEMAGIYVFFWQIYSALCNLLRTGVVQISRPKLVLAYKEHDPAYMSLVKQCAVRTAALALLTALVGAVVVYILLPWLNQPELMDWYPLIVPVMLAYIIFITGEALGLVFYSQHQDYLTLRISLLMFMSSIALNILLVPFFSLWGAVSALLGMSLILFLVQAYFVHKAR